MIKGTTRGQRLTLERDFIVTDTIKYLTAHFDLSEEWSPYTVYAHFAKDGSEISSGPFEIDTAGDITENAALNLTKGCWNVWLHGNRTDSAGTVHRIASNVVDLQVIASGVDNGNPFPTLTPSVVETQVEQAHRYADAAEDAKDAAVAAKEAAEDAAGSITAMTWNTLPWKPNSFPPSAHQHSYSDITDPPTIPEAYDDTELQGRVDGLDENVTSLIGEIQNKVDKSAIMDAGLKTESWITILSGNFTTVQDIYASQRPTGTSVRYWTEISDWTGGRLIWEKLYRVTVGHQQVYDNVVCRYGVIQDIPSIGESGYDNPVDGASESHAMNTTYSLIGNKHLYDSRYYDTGEPFCIVYIEHYIGTTCPYFYSSTIGNVILFTDAAKTVSIKVEKSAITYKELPKFLTDNFGALDDLYARSSDGSSYRAPSLGVGNIVGRGNVAIGNSNIALNGGDTSATMAIGIDNYVSDGWAIGGFNKVTAGGAFSIGTRNESSGDFSCSIGVRNKTTGKYSQAFGYGNKASAQNSHAEGCGNTASGEDSHVEGFGSTSSGMESHAEGYKTSAAGDSSHSEGTGTLASSEAQHVQGKYNINDVNGEFAHIIGNGTESNRSNAHTVDWNGNAWFAGTLTIGSNRETVAKVSDIPTDEHISALINSALGGVEHGSY